MKVLFYPDAPIQRPGHSLSKTIQYFQILGWELTNDPASNWSLGVHWNYKEINTIPEIFLDNNRLILNMRLTDVTKSNVDKIFTSVFGYSSLADTKAFGYCVRKSEKQSAHDGEIIKIPCEKEPGYVYQILIDNRISLSMVCDIRIPIFLGEIPNIYRKGISMEGAFAVEKAKHKEYYTAPWEDFISVDELDKIKLFCKEIGLDIGEIDTVRDNSTGLLYLIDVNNTPGDRAYTYIKNGNEVRLQHANFLKKQLDEISQEWKI